MTLLAPDTARIGRPEGPARDDRAPDSLAAGTAPALAADLGRLVGEDSVLGRAHDLIRYASDASPYRLFPEVVVMANGVEDVRSVLGYCRDNGKHVTFRSGGTSLNGQGQSDGILMDTRRNFHGVRVEDGGQHAWVKPGTVLGFANRVLARHGYGLGPDPASTDAATVGGVIANNSGGMRCGTVWDSYSTVRGMKLVLASGTEIDTTAPGAEEDFAKAEPALARGLIEIRDELRADTALAERVKRKFEIKNTMGYRLCAFLDADTPLEIFRRLVVGSEGTLAFVAEAKFETRPVPKRTTISWIHFASVDAAAQPVPGLVAAGARACELMVAPALIAAAYTWPECPDYWKEIPPDSAALLVEYGGDDDGELDRHVAEAEEILTEHELLRPTAFTRGNEEIELAWMVREGLFGLTGRLRPEGTSLIIEDVCVPPERIAECAGDLMGLLAEHQFLPGVAGHASAGNLHFNLTPALGDPADVERYESFMGKLVPLIVEKYDGSLKAEHGTGRNMAPYVEAEWGEKATAMMWRIKELADPQNVLNPGVILNRDPGVHLRDLQSTPPIEAEANVCVECGFCEPVCPSRNATTTPRQRIVLRREMARQPEGSPVYEALLADYEHEAIQTCAADSSCLPVCPVAIDTGKLMKDFRGREHTEREEKVALGVAKRYATVEKLARGGLRAGDAVGDTVAGAGPSLLRKRVSADLVPTWPDDMPPAAPAKLPATRREGAAAVYMPACINRIFGNPRGLDATSTLPEVLVEVSARAGKPVWIPDDVAGNCCSTPWASKGYKDGQEFMAAKVADSLRRWTDGGKLPVVIDASSCTHALLDACDDIEVIDSVAWAHDHLLPELEVRRKVGSVAVHPTCSTNQMGLRPKLVALAWQLADDVVVPAGSTCCGMAGDRGLLHPELPESALRDTAAELDGKQLDACLCSNRTCEVGLQQVTGRPYGSFVFLLEQLTR